MLAQNMRPSLAGHYQSDRVYEGVRHVSKDDAAINRIAILRAFRRMLESAERAEVERVATD